MPAQHSDESNRELMEDIQRKSDVNRGGETPREMQIRIAEEHAKRIRENQDYQGYESEEAQASIDAQIIAANRDYVPDPPKNNVIPLSGKDGDIVRKCSTSGEPVFVLRAKDIFSTMAIAKYLEIVEAYGPSDYEFQQAIAERLQEFKDWQGANTDKVRYPD